MNGASDSELHGSPAASVELLIVHALLSHWCPILSALTLASILWLVGA